MTRLTDDWVRDPAAQAVLGCLTNAGHQAYFVGGCVRNALLGQPVSDIDVATDATPETVSDLAEMAGLNPVPTGIDHGTITVVAHGTGIEVTTFRADIDTDGRHATVRFTNKVEEDARRRDFTMNALYADADGQVIDPIGGLPDLQAGHVRFIDNARDRIREDYLRILRFFRFFAWYGDSEQGIDIDAMDAIAVSLDGLDRLSAERVGTELTKLFAAPNPSQAVAAMAACGALGRILPGTDARALPILVDQERAHGITPNPVRRLAVLGPVDGAALRMKKTDQRMLDLLRDGIGSGVPAHELAYRHGLDTTLDILLLRAATFETPVSEPDIDAARVGAHAVFPVRAADLMPRFEGAELGQALRDLEDRWIASRFTLDRDALLS